MHAPPIVAAFFNATFCSIAFYIIKPYCIYSKSVTVANCCTDVTDFKVNNISRKEWKIYGFTNLNQLTIVVILQDHAAGYNNSCKCVLDFLTEAIIYLDHLCLCRRLSCISEGPQHHLGLYSSALVKSGPISIMISIIWRVCCFWSSSCLWPMLIQSG